MLMRAYSIPYACSTAVFIVVTLALILLPEARSFKGIMNGLVKGAIWGTQVGIILSIIGILATTATATGLAPKGTAALFALTGGALLPSLLMIAILGIILGMGIPMSAAYTVLAIMLVPGLRKLGVDLIAAHFFALYYSAYSILTPPYAPAAMVASRLSGGNFWRTGLMAMKFMIVPFFLPFVIALHPKLMNFPFIGLHEFILILVVLLAGVNIATALFNWFLTRLNRFTRSLAIIAALGNLAFTLDLGLFPLIIGLSCMAMMVFLQAVTFLTQRRRDLESSPVRDGRAVS